MEHGTKPLVTCENHTFKTNFVLLNLALSLNTSMGLFFVIKKAKILKTYTKEFWDISVLKQQSGSTSLSDIFPEETKSIIPLMKLKKNCYVALLKTKLTLRLCCFLWWNFLKQCQESFDHLNQCWWVGSSWGIWISRHFFCYIFIFK